MLVTVNAVVPRPTRLHKHYRCVQYSWIADQRDSHKKTICQRTRRGTTIPRPPLKSSQQGEFRSAWYIFVKFIFDLLIVETNENMAPTRYTRQIWIRLVE